MAEPAKPAETPNWATDAGVTISTPPGGKQATGWISEKPPFQFWNWLHYWTAKWIAYFMAKLDILPGANADTVLTLTVGGVITPTQGNHSLDTFAAAGTQNLVNALTTNLNDGRMLILSPENVAHIVTVKHAAGGAGQFHLYDGNDLALGSVNEMLVLKRVGADWYEVSRSIASPGGPTVTIFSATGTYTVPLNRNRIRTKKWGAGGGGSGGAGGGGAAAGGSGAGGGSGAFQEDSQIVVPGAVINVVVGVGGAGSAGGALNAGTGAGTDGGDSYVDTNVLKAAGGKGGGPTVSGATNPATGGAVGAAGVAVNSASRFGVSGLPGIVGGTGNPNPAQAGGDGGGLKVKVPYATPTANGVGGAAGNNPGTDASDIGCGGAGGGGGIAGGHGGNGGKGGDGLVMIYS